MARMSEREWQAFAASKNLNPDTGKQVTDEEPGFISKLELDQRIAGWSKPELAPTRKRNPELDAAILSAIPLIIVLIWAFVLW